MVTAAVSTLKDCVFIFSSFLMKTKRPTAVPGVDAVRDEATALYTSVTKVVCDLFRIKTPLPSSTGELFFYKIIQNNDIN